jgi:putative endopeptidase
MSSGIDIAGLSTTVRPQDDLYRHVNGTWLDTTEIPEDRAIYGTFHRLHDLGERNLLAIVQELAASEAEPGTEARKIGDLFASFMDEPAIDARGAEPIAPDLARIAAVEDAEALTALMGELAGQGLGGFFSFFVDTDARDSGRYIAYLHQGGLGLPDESYYREDGFAPIREGYVAHIARMLTHADHADPDAAAWRVMAVETRLATSHWDRVRDRDATKTYNKVSRAELQALTPGFAWATWISALDDVTPGSGVESAFDEVVVRQPSYLEEVAHTLGELPLEDLKDWLAWHVVHAAAPLLSSPFVSENFAFYGTTLTGAPQLRDRWKRGLAVVEGALGEALGKIYVERHFPPTAAARMQELVDNLVEAYRQHISALEWMSPVTRERALGKLDKFTPKIGYPKKWRDYSALEIDAEDLVGNARRSAAVELARDLDKLGKTVDRDEWFMTPQTINAYYNPGMNEIVFPAAILQPPFFDAEADDAANYGAIGAVIGHEIGHGFDDQGSKYDGDGNLNDWWTDDDRKEFELRTERLIVQYDALEPLQTPGQHVNGALTVGENIGDLGGLSIAYTAYRLSLKGGDAPQIDGLSGAERFFLAWAQAWRTKARNAEVERRLALDPHAPDEFRCNAVVRNIDAFHETFDVTEGDQLWLSPQERVRIW